MEFLSLGSLSVLFAAVGVGKVERESRRDSLRLPPEKVPFRKSHGKGSTRGSWSNIVGMRFSSCLGDIGWGGWKAGDSKMRRRDGINCNIDV